MPNDHSARQYHVDAAKYQEMYAASVADPEAFWAEQGKRIDWIKPYSQVKDVSFAPGDIHIKWYHDGTLNVSANCIDRHLETRGDQTAIIWEPDDPEEPAQHISYRELHANTCKMANVLTDLGVTKGDRAASMKQAFENFRLFGAPHTAIITSGRELGSYGALDTGVGQIRGIGVAAALADVHRQMQVAVMLKLNRFHVAVAHRHGGCLTVGHRRIRGSGAGGARPFDDALDIAGVHALNPSGPNKTGSQCEPVSSCLQGISYVRAVRRSCPARWRWGQCQSGQLPSLPHCRY